MIKKQFLLKQSRTNLIILFLHSDILLHVDFVGYMYHLNAFCNF